MKIDPTVIKIFLGILAVLVLASTIGWAVGRKNKSAVVVNLNARIRAWWAMVAIFALAVCSGAIGATILFFLISFLALREYITLTPSARTDHRALFWSFFIILPVQYVLVGIQWYGLFAIFIPVYAFAWIPIRIALTGDSERFLERSAKIQWGLMLCVYSVSYAPMLLSLKIHAATDYTGKNPLLLIFLVVVAQSSDVLQYVWGKLCGKHKIAPKLSPNKTWEGFLGGILSSSLIGMGLYWITPFQPWQAALIALLICLLGFCGGLVMSAIKRDRGVKDFGAMIEGHGGILDRIDSLCFAAPVFFHVVRQFWVD